LTPIALQQSSLKGGTETSGALQSQKNKTNPLTALTKYDIIKTPRARVGQDSKCAP